MNQTFLSCCFVNLYLFAKRYLFILIFFVLFLGDEDVNCSSSIVYIVLGSNYDEQFTRIIQPYRQFERWRP